MSELANWQVYAWRHWQDAWDFLHKAKAEDCTVLASDWTPGKLARLKWIPNGEAGDFFYVGNYIPPQVKGAIYKAWPDQAEEICRDLTFAGDHFAIRRWGMYVGVEFDGYIHS